MFDMSGIALDPSDPEEYTMITNFVFFEFIPVDNMNDEDPHTLFMEQVSGEAE